MSTSLPFAPLVLAVLACAASLSATAAETPLTTPLTPPAVQAISDADAATVPGHRAEFEQRLNAGTVHELRATSNGDYTTRLLIADDQAVFYVAMSYQRSLWRVIRLQSQGPAEDTYARLARQSAAWAENDIQRQVLSSRKHEAEKALQLGEARAQALSREVAAMEAERARMVAEREAIAAERRAVAAEGRDTTAKVGQLQNQIRQMEAELANPGTSATHRAATRRSRPQALAKSQ